MKNMPKGECRGMGDLDKMMEKDHDKMMNTDKKPEMVKIGPMPKMGGGMKGGMKGGGGSHGGHG